MRWAALFVGGGFFTNALVLVRLGVAIGRWQSGLAEVIKDQETMLEDHKVYERRLDNHGSRLAVLETYHPPVWPVPPSQSV